jgi:hypothetical protein
MPTGALSEYAQIEETIAPKALELIATWILEHTTSSFYAHILMDIEYFETLRGPN